MISARISRRQVLVLCGVLFGSHMVMAQAPAPARLLVLLRNASALAIVDPGSGKVLGRVPTVKDPHEVVASADGRTAYVGSPSEGIGVIDIASMKETRRINPGPRSAPHDVLVSNQKLFFTIEGYKAFGLYDLSTDRIEWTLGAGQGGPHMLVLSADGNSMFMSNPGSNSVTFVDGVSAGPPKWQVTSIPIPGRTTEGIDKHPNGREIWTVARGDGSVSVIDVASKKVVQTLKTNMKDANRLKITPDGRLALFLDGGSGSLVVMDTATRQEVKRLQLHPTPTGSGGMMIARDGSRAYVGLRDAHKVSVVDLKTLTAIAEWPMGENSGPGCTAWAQGPAGATN